MPKSQSASHPAAQPATQTAAQPAPAQAQPAGSLRGLLITLVAALLAFGLYHVLPYEDMVNRGLAILCFVAVLWFTEALHITVTALMVPLLALLFKIPDMNTRSVLAHFADPIIFVFFGGFALATALHIQQLDRKIALWVISLSRGNMRVAVLLLFAVTTFLSMWISNTATAAMMLPLALGLMGHIDRERQRKTFVFVLLGVAYCASIGGMGTYVGSPPNGIAARALGLDFWGWMRLGLPIMLLLLPTMLMALYAVLRPDFSQRVDTRQQELIAWTPQRVLTVLVFCATAAAWIMGSAIAQATGIASIDSFIALAAAVAVVLLGTVQWRDVVENTDWGVLMLFGGGITLSALMKNSGASAALGQAVAGTFGQAHPLVVVAVVAVFIVFLTEFTSNTASAALLVPVFAGIATELGMPREMLVMVIGIGASCAFMLPVATPPNAIVFGSGLIRQQEMMSAGLVLNLLCAAVVSLWAYFLL
ncbi:SLC13 family permease [Vandammella animalimorsus]|uniref:Anion:sodium symporter n=1 Tax=Vandammella animalimorsus TaxID=2029117 RepID=A0A2A2ALU0_9BURK|nr:DASS family sodium-coupled anion symporter [Vandammella animalimorsus]PAT38682.1 anion:sodium symporter [Vandammella animalimorsus]